MESLKQKGVRGGCLENLKGVLLEFPDSQDHFKKNLAQEKFERERERLRLLG